MLLSVKAPKIAAEFARVLDPSGHLLVVVSAPDDLLELRAATAGAGFSRSPAEQALELFAGAFELQGRFEVRNREQYDARKGCRTCCACRIGVRKE
ncbi:MAG: hypothetical protein R3E96_16455 [Planctomycetota bacterium]